MSPVVGTVYKMASRQSSLILEFALKKLNSKGPSNENNMLEAPQAGEYPQESKSLSCRFIKFN